MAERKIYTFAPAATLTTVVLILLCLCALADLFAMFSDWMTINALQAILNGEEIPQERAEQIDSLSMASAMGQLSIFLVTGLTFLKWTYRMSRNAHSLQPDAMEITPPWAVGYYFVPFINLVRPYQAIRESYENLAGSNSSPGYGFVLGCWWGMWLVNNILGQVASKMSLRDGTLEESLTGSQVMLASNLVSVISAAAAFLMVQMVGAASHHAEENSQQMPSADSIDDLDDDFG